MSALRTRLTRGARVATASTARLTTSMASSHVSASMVVNIDVVSCGSPDSRTTRTASATTSPTLSDPPPEGATLNATSMGASVPHPVAGARHRLRGRTPALLGGDPWDPRADRLVADHGGGHQRDARAADPPLGRRRRAAPAWADLRPLRGAGAVELLATGAAADARDGRAASAAPHQRHQHRRSVAGR